MYGCVVLYKGYKIVPNIQLTLVSSEVTEKKLRQLCISTLSEISTPTLKVPEDHRNKRLFLVAFEANNENDFTLYFFTYILLLKWAKIHTEKVATRGLCANAQAESLHYKLLGGLAMCRACYGIFHFVLESGAKGCEVVVSGKLRSQRAKSMKFVDGLMIHSRDSVKYYIDTAMHHVLLRQGVLGIKIKIMTPWDPSGKIGPKKPLSDHVNIVEPKDETLSTTPISEQNSRKTEKPAMLQPVSTA
ncbi:LOW QUALITY PROTEIN: 40S ribosomal protein S3-like [Dromiciops gliroides]|uniref:LOW QUALITY PROTEIN: 40S ribosomal protein S3-like n=1 Tax=Dromiciops gliroides TaxID=33562 RepID=UPI001CC3A85A|nr:LOW QUALITY PROTEIN: 40S ribosomal protein S3-like [Dromiciops gliroides]